MSTVATVGQSPCPACAQPNPAAAEYCWACYFDLKPDAVAAPAPGVEAPPMAEANPAGPRHPGMPWLLVLTVLSSAIVYGSWLVLAETHVPIMAFAGGWVALLMLTSLVKLLLPAPSSNLRHYWSLNPFQYRDNMNRMSLSLHLWTFIPGIVLTTLGAWLHLVVRPRRS